MVPPGLAMVSISQQAWQAHAEAKMPRFYWDFSQAKSYLERGQTPWTPAVTVVYSLAVALGSRMIAEKRNAEWVEDAFIAGLLHDAGKIILNPYIVEREKAFKKALGNGQPRFIDAEKKILGFDHAEVMSRAIRFWRYPESQSTAIRYHHCPSRSEDSELAYIVHLADAVAKEAGFKSENGVPQSEIDPQTLRYLGFQKEDITVISAEIVESVEKLATEFQ